MFAQQTISNTQTMMATYGAALMHALGSDLPNAVSIEEGKVVYRRPTHREVRIRTFFQVWETTSLGFLKPPTGLLQEPRVTSTRALTVVVRFAAASSIYFGGHHAYSLHENDDAFEEDLTSERLVGQSDAIHRYRAELSDGIWRRPIPLKPDPLSNRTPVRPPAHNPYRHVG